jgi:hypothetical protein
MPGISLVPRLKDPSDNLYSMISIRIRWKEQLRSGFEQILCSAIGLLRR